MATSIKMCIGSLSIHFIWRWVRWFASYVNPLGFCDTSNSKATVVSGSSSSIQILHCSTPLFTRLACQTTDRRQSWLLLSFTVLHGHGPLNIQKWRHERQRTTGEQKRQLPASPLQDTWQKGGFSRSFLLLCLPIFWTLYPFKPMSINLRNLFLHVFGGPLMHICNIRKPRRAVGPHKQFKVQT